MTSTLWYYRFPGDFFACGPIRFDEPVGERKARARLRKVYEVDRLPRGTEVWPTSQQEINAIVESNRRIGWRD